MQYGFVVPYGDAREVADLAHEAEEASWDGIFVCDPVWGIDAWVSLTAAAMVTTRIRLGTMLTPISRRRPWQLAAQAATLDRLSHGRAILAVGLGAPETGFDNFGEVTDRRVRAELMDEGLAILDGLWRGQPFAFEGKHYQVKETTFLPPPPPVQRPRIPIWVVGLWPSTRSMSRVVRWDGVIPQKRGGPCSPDDIRALKLWVEQQRVDGGTFDIITEGTTPGDDPATAAEIVRPWADAGVTWWTETMWSAMDCPAAVRTRIAQGPPHVP
jgi:hypothetical protein